MAMNQSSSFFLLVIFCSVIQFYRRVLQFLGFILMDCASSLKLLTQSNNFGFGFVVFGYFSKFYNVMALLFMFLLGLKFLLFNSHYKGLGQYFYEFRVKSSEWKNGFYLKFSPFEAFDITNRKNPDCVCGTSNTVSRILSKVNGDHGSVDAREEVVDSNDDPQQETYDTNAVRHEDDDEEVLERCDEDEVFDVMALRKMVKYQRRRANATLIELEKERMAASSAANEAMAMILRLQNEKGSIQILANQLQRLAEEKQFHDQEVIQSLQWVIIKHESERSLLENQLRWCKERLKKYGEEDSVEDQFDVATTPAPSLPHSFSAGSWHDDAFISSLDFDSMTIFPYEIRCLRSGYPAEVRCLRSSYINSSCPEDGKIHKTLLEV